MNKFFIKFLSLSQYVWFFLICVYTWRENINNAIYCLLWILVIELVLKIKFRYDKQETLTRLNNLIDEQEETLAKFEKINRIK